MATHQPELPIAVFDSGVGGLSIQRAIAQLLPNEHLRYVADTAYLPYGARSVEEIQTRLAYVIDTLNPPGTQQIKALVIACNTATTVAIDWVRTRYPELLLVGVEPAIKPACQRSQTHVVGVLATARTVASPGIQRLIERFSNGCTILPVACPGWVECVESGAQSAEALRCVKPQLDFLLEQHADMIVLGCTHYPFLEPAIRSYLSQQVPTGQPIPEIIETGLPVAQQLQRLLQHRDILRHATAQPSCYTFEVTGQIGAAQNQLFSQLWGAAVQVKQFA